MLKTISPPCWQSGLCLGPECSLDPLIMLLTNFSMCEVQVYTSHLWKTSTMNSLMSPRSRQLWKRAKQYKVNCSSVGCCKTFSCHTSEEARLIWMNSHPQTVSESKIFITSFSQNSPISHELEIQILFFIPWFKFVLITYHWPRNYFPRTHLAKYKLTSGMLRNPYSWGRMDLLDRCTVCLTDS